MSIDEAKPHAPRPAPIRSPGLLVPPSRRITCLGTSSPRACAARIAAPSRRRYRPSRVKSTPEKPSSPATIQLTAVAGASLSEALVLLNDSRRSSPASAAEVEEGGIAAQLAWSERSASPRAQRSAQRALCKAPRPACRRPNRRRPFATELTRGRSQIVRNDARREREGSRRG